jgi:CheY-like chemotaxis protein
MATQRSNLNSTVGFVRDLEGVKVVLVEDEVDIANLLLFILEDAGAEVTLFTEAEPVSALLEILKPDVLLININLPGHNGNWLIRQIRAHPCRAVSRLPALAITSYLRTVSADCMLEAGFDAFISKLTEPDELIATLLRTMARGTN